jgi:Flp pilus assembly pilin Flp
MKFAQLKDRNERGATIVEAAIVYGLLFLALFAVIEFGLGFKNWLSVSHAAREGARAGATYGSNPRADIQILNDVAGTLAAASIADGLVVRIFEPGGQSTTYTYSPPGDCSDNSPGNILVGCCEWTPCPEPFRDSYTVPNWNPANRDDSAPFTDRIAVEVQFTHVWVTGFFSPDADFTTVTDFAIEPQVFD